MSARVSEEQCAIENLRQNMDVLPFASIIIPVYNGERTIGECIESLLHQDYPQGQYEVIIVDNNSNDNTMQIIKKYPVKIVIEDKVQGPAAARNKGSELARGEALVFFDADQVAEKSWLRKLLAGWEQEKFGAFGSRRIAVSSKNSMAGRYWNQNTSTRIAKFSSNRMNYPFLKLSTGNAAYRRNVFQRLGGFDISLFGLEDYDLALRLQKELGYLIKYNFDAIVYHKERPTVKSMLKREYRTGFARYQFECKHSEFRIPLWAYFIKAVKRTIIGLGALGIGFFKSLKRSRKEHTFLIIFDIGMRWANFLGMVEGILTRKKGSFPSYW